MVKRHVEEIVVGEAGVARGIPIEVLVSGKSPVRTLIEIHIRPFEISVEVKVVVVAGTILSHLELVTATLSDCE